MMAMTRTTIMADEALLDELRQIARQDGVSLAEVIRQAMQLRVDARRRKLPFIAAGRSKKDAPPVDWNADLPFKPRSWR